MTQFIFKIALIGLAHLVVTILLLENSKYIHDVFLELPPGFGFVVLLVPAVLAISGYLYVAARAPVGESTLIFVITFLAAAISLYFGGLVGINTFGT